MTSETRSPPLRAYQREPIEAIYRSVMRGDGLSFSVEMSRQSGKNEMSARLERGLMYVFASKSAWRNGVKCAPTLEPQCVRSKERLEQKFAEIGENFSVLSDGMKLHYGTTSMTFASAEPDAHVVGDTASMLLEVDEAQDVDPDKFNKDFRPMAASTNATTVYYGTPWDDNSLLEQAKQEHLKLERRDGIRRHFEVSWERVAAEVPAYRKYVEAERDRLGADHPLFLTQYAMRTIPGQGRLFDTSARAVLQGAHPPLDGPATGEHYVAGLDIGGTGEISKTREGHDPTVLTIGRVYNLPGIGSEPRLAVDVVKQYSWAGTSIEQLWGAILQLLQYTWRVGKVAGDATGLGEPAMVYLMKALGESKVEAVKFSRSSKSEMGFDLLAAVTGGRFRIHAADGSAEYATFWSEIEKARVEYLPGQLMNFYVDESDGHDDYLMSSALLVRAAKGGEPRVARGRSRDGW